MYCSHWARILLRAFNSSVKMSLSYHGCLEMIDDARVSTRQLLVVPACSDELIVSMILISYRPSANKNRWPGGM